MPIPASGFSLQTVCNEFTTPVRYQNSPTLCCFFRFASQESILGSNASGCRLSQFGNKCRGSIIGTPSATLTPQNGIYEYCVCVSNEFGAGDDLRPTNSTLTEGSLVVCWVHDPPSFEGGSCIVDGGTTTTTATLSGFTILENPDPTNGNVTTTVYAQPRVFNGFGLLTGSLSTVGTIPWLAEGL